LTVSSSTATELDRQSGSTAANAAVTAFICANCTRTGHAPDSGGRSRPAVPNFAWPFLVREVLVPCTGRLQPEHVLKAFETGADLVVTVSCEEDNCLYLEGSQRWALRVDFVRGILDQIGLGGERLLHFHLPGSARQDMALGAGRQAPAQTPAAFANDLDARIAAIRDSVVQSLDGVTPNPLTPFACEAAEEPYQELDVSDDANED
jgi:coenzyme F420-reducing hydrogenase delta subunit